MVDGNPHFHPPSALHSENALWKSENLFIDCVGSTPREGISIGVAEPLIIRIVSFFFLLRPDRGWELHNFSSEKIRAPAPATCLCAYVCRVWREFDKLLNTRNICVHSVEMNFLAFPDGTKFADGIKVITSVSSQRWLIDGILGALLWKIQIQTLFVVWAICLEEISFLDHRVVRIYKYLYKVEFRCQCVALIVWGTPIPG